jgi:hypothetical protein
MALSTLASDILGDLDDIRTIPGEMGLCPWTVYVRVRTWTGPRPGVGQYVDKDTQITNGAYPNDLQNPVVRHLNPKEIIASGGLYQEHDYKVGPITPPYPSDIGVPAAGFGDSSLDPTGTANGIEVFWNIAGPGTPAGQFPNGGNWCSKVADEAGPLDYYVVLRVTGRQP